LQFGNIQIDPLLNLDSPTVEGDNQRYPPTNPAAGCGNRRRWMRFIMSWVGVAPPTRDDPNENRQEE
ncbi:MAG: hypothetical protein ACRD88_22840, partial [Terriglobia bacterium]